MTFMSVRASATSRLAALVLLLSMTSPFIAISSPADPLAATTRVVESATNEIVALDALVEPLVRLVIDPQFAAVRLLPASRPMRSCRRIASPI